MTSESAATIKSIRMVFLLQEGKFDPDTRTPEAASLWHLFVAKRLEMELARPTEVYL
jgi:hypothetical protein